MATTKQPRRESVSDELFAEAIAIVIVLCVVAYIAVHHRSSDVERRPPVLPCQTSCAHEHPPLFVETP